MTPQSPAPNASRGPASAPVPPSPGPAPTSPAPAPGPASALPGPAEVAAKDRRHFWHPFTQMQVWEADDPLIVVAGEGVRVRDIRGREYYDGHSSLWVNLHGHRKAAIDRAIIAQLGRIAHATTLGLTNPPAALLAERLAALAPRGLTRVFYSDNGSGAVEVALKMAYQYWVHRGRPERRRFVSLANGYHGDTLGAVSVGGIDRFHAVFRPLLFEAYQAPSPYCYRCPLGREPGSAGSEAASAPGASPARGAAASAASAASASSAPVAAASAASAAAASAASAPACGLACAEALGEILAAHAAEVAAVIVEPLVQAAGGMITAPPGYLRRVRELCDRHGVLLIADEVATGFGRTGRMFACEHEGVAPDLMPVAKGITGGYLPLAATLATEEIYAAFLGEPHEGKTFYHGHSYTGNALACAAALASLDVFEEERVLEGLPAKVARVAEGLAPFRDLPHVGDVRQRGLMAGIELVRDRATREPYPAEAFMGVRACRRSTELGMITRPLGDVVVFMPPLASSLADLDAMLEILYRAIQDVTG